MTTNREVITFIIDCFEGHMFVDDPLDRGGATRFGVTQRLLGHWLGRPATREDVEGLTYEEARSILLYYFLEQPGYHQVHDAELRLILVDYAVHSSPSRATYAVQGLVGVRRDRIFGPITARTVNEGPVRPLIGRLLADRLRFLGRLLRRDPRQVQFAPGWTARVGALVERATVVI